MNTAVLGKNGISIFNYPALFTDNRQENDSIAPLLNVVTGIALRNYNVAVRLLNFVKYENALKVYD